MVYWQTLWLATRNQLLHPKSALLTFFFSTLNTLTLYVLWLLLFDRFPRIGRADLSDISFLFGMATAVVGLTTYLCGGIFELPYLIRTRNLDLLLLNPKRVLTCLLPRQSLLGGVATALSSIVFFAVSEYVSWSDIPFIVLCIANGLIVFTSVILWTSSITFWLPSGSEISRYFEQFMMTFLLFSETWFSKPVRLLLYTLIPVGLISYWPLSIIKEPSLKQMALITVASGGFFLVSLLIFSLGLRRYGR